MHALFCHALKQHTTLQQCRFIHIQKIDVHIYKSQYTCKPQNRFDLSLTHLHIWLAHRLNNSYKRVFVIIITLIDYQLWILLTLKWSSVKVQSWRLSLCECPLSHTIFPLHLTPHLFSLVYIKSQPDSCQTLKMFSSAAFI